MICFPPAFVVSMMMICLFPVLSSFEKRIAKSFARLFPVLLAGSIVDRCAPAYEEMVLSELLEIEFCQTRMMSLVDECHAETFWRSWENVRLWHKFFEDIRYSAKGLWMALKKQSSRLEHDDDARFLDIVLVVVVILLFTTSFFFFFEKFCKFFCVSK